MEKQKMQEAIEISPAHLVPGFNESFDDYYRRMEEELVRNDSQKRSVWERAKYNSQSLLSEKQVAARKKRSQQLDMFRWAYQSDKTKLAEVGRQNLEEERALAQNIINLLEAMLSSKKLTDFDRYLDEWLEGGYSTSFSGVEIKLPEIFEQYGGFQDMLNKRSLRRAADYFLEHSGE